MPKKENRKSNIGMIIGIIILLLGLTIAVATGQPFTLLLALL